MKTIAVLTDFSASAEHAAMYALHLAKKISANVVLYSVCPAPVPKQLVTATGFAEDDDQETRTENADSLLLLTRKLENRLKECSFAGTVLPEITRGIQGAEIVDVMTSVINDNDIMLIVTSPGINDDLEAFVQGDDCRRIIDWATVPVLVVPDSASIRNFEKIAFVSESGPAETTYINLLVNLVNKFAPEIMVAQLENHGGQHNNSISSAKTLSNSIYNNVDYGRIYCRSIPPAKQNGWAWLKENKKCDMLVMVQQPQSAVKEFFQRGRAPQVTHHITAPILIFPAII